MNKQEFLHAIKGRLIVSCQALADEPLHGAEIMARMAIAAKQGGAAAIRANSAEDVAAIRRSTGLPVIGLVKRDYPDSEVYITPTKRELLELLEAGADVIALDATLRKRPGGESLEELVSFIRSESSCLIMADVSTLEEGLNASRLRVDLISTTLSGYTPYSPKQEGPDFDLIGRLVECVDTPIVAEGRINTPEEAKQAMELGAYSIVVGSAITRPQLITERFAKAIEKNGERSCKSQT